MLIISLSNLPNRHCSRTGRGRSWRGRGRPWRRRGGRWRPPGPSPRPGGRLGRLQKSVRKSFLSFICLPHSPAGAVPMATTANATRKAKSATRILSFEVLKERICQGNDRNTSQPTTLPWMLIGKCSYAGILGGRAYIPTNLKYDWWCLLFDGDLAAYKFLQ